jgi:hypothetical protein
VGFDWQGRLFPDDQNFQKGIAPFDYISIIDSFTLRVERPLFTQHFCVGHMAVGGWCAPARLRNLRSRHVDHIDRGLLLQTASQKTIMFIFFAMKAEI